MNILQAVSGDEHADYYQIGNVVIGRSHAGVLTLEGMKTINHTVISLRQGSEAKYLLADLRNVTKFPNGLRDQLAGAQEIVREFEKSVLLTNNIGLELFGATVNRLLRWKGFAIVGSVDQAAKEFGVALHGYS